MRICQFRPKQNVGWARTKKPSRPTLLIFYAIPIQENFLDGEKNIICQRAFFLEKMRNAGWKISVGTISRPLSAIEFSIQSLNEICMKTVSKYFFCRGGLMFSWPKQNVGWTRTKNLAEVHCNFFMQHQNKKTYSAVKRPLSTSEFF